jgi:signal transduction histidine kinase
MGSANPYFIGVLFLSILLLGTALYGWRSAPSVAMNRGFAAQTLLVTCWAIGIAGLHSGYATELWGRWTFTAVALMPPAFLRFVDSFPSRPFGISLFVARSTQILALLFASIASLTPWIAHSFVVRKTVLVRTPGFMMPAFSVFFLALTIVIFVILAMKIRAASGVGRAQLRLYSVGLFLFCVGATTTNLILPYVLDDSRYSILGPWFVLVFLAFVAHGIIRHRFMNLRLVCHNWLTVALASAIALSPLTLSVAIQRSTASRSEIGDLVILVVGGLATPLWLVTRRLLHRYVYRGDADFRSLVSRGSEQLSRMLGPNEISDVIAETISLAVRPNGIAVFTTSHDTRDAPLILTHNSGKQSPERSLCVAITQAIGNGRILASPTQVAVETQGEMSLEALQALEEHNWALVLPLNLDAEIVGAVAIGEKLSGAPYYREDVSLLRILTRQATFAFKNARLYQHVVLANQQIENIVATVPSGILVYYSENNVRILNHSALRLLGLNDAPTPAVVTKETLPCALTIALEQSLNSLDGVFEFALQCGQESIPVICATSALRSTDGTTFGVVVALTDVSLVNALEVERGRAERLEYYETLAAMLAHEIANPLAPIKAMTQLLAERVDDVGFVTQCAKTVTREVKRIERLVDRLRALSRPSSHQKHPLDVAVAVDEAISVVTPFFEERGIVVHLSTEASQTIVSGDADDLHELFLNLLINAAEATNPNSSVDVTVSADAEIVRVAITDHGPGIPPTLIDKLFEPLVSSKNRGSGLGLTVCQGIVARHRGRIEAVNHIDGAKFIVELPLATTQTINVTSSKATV